MILAWLFLGLQYFILFYFLKQMKETSLQKGLVYSFSLSLGL